MPAEWEPQTATWIAWPHNASDWPGPLPADPLGVCGDRAPSGAVEQVHILVQTAEAEKRVRGVLKRAQANVARVFFHQWPTEPSVDARIRGPFSSARRRWPVTKTGLRELEVQAWAKYPDWELDNALPGRVGGAAGLPSVHAGVTFGWQASNELVLEGGSIDTNGEGVL